MRKVSRSIIASGLVAAFAFSAQAADTYPASGRINSVDTTQGEVNVTHGPIAGLGWPGMTMTFPVVDKATTQKLRAGQTVKFWLERRDGRYVITRIAPASGSK